MPSRLSVIPAEAITDSRLTDGDIRVLAALGTFTDRGGKCWPSVQAVARVASRTPRSVQRSFTSLAAAGYITKVARWGRSNVYVVKLDTPDTTVTPDATDTQGVTPASPTPDASVTQNVTKERYQGTIQKLATESEMDLHIRMAALANQELKNNPRCRLGDLQIRPLQAARAKQCAEDWQREGIPENVILDAIGDVCKRFQPTKENPRIGSFRYFEATVHKAWKEAKQGDALDAAFASLE